MIVKHHNTFPKADLIKPFDLPICDLTSSVGLIKRIVLSMDICLGIRPTSMHKLSLSRFRDVQIGNETIIIYTERIGSSTTDFKGKRRHIIYLASYCSDSNMES